VGAGACGENGNERIFSADQSASDCDGNLAGPYVTFGLTVDTTTTVLGDDTVVYSVKLPAHLGAGFNQNQLTTLPGNGVRVRTAQGFSFGAELPDYASFYREYKLANRTEWLAKLAEVRAAMMQCKTPTAYDKVYKVRGPRPPSHRRRFKKGGSIGDLAILRC